MSDAISRGDVISPEKQLSMNIAADMYELQVVETVHAEPVITKRELGPEEWKFDGNYGHKSIAEFTITGVDITGGNPTFTTKNGPSTWMGWGYNHGEFTNEDATFTWAKENGHLAADATPADMNIYGNRVGVNVEINDVQYRVGNILGVENYAFKVTEQSFDVDAELQERYKVSLTDEQKQNMTFTLEHHTIRWGSLDVDEVTVETAVPATTTTTTTSTTTTMVPEVTTTTVPETTTTSNVPATTTTTVFETTTTTPEITATTVTDTTTTTEPEWGLIPPISIVREPDVSVPVAITEQSATPSLAETGGDSLSTAALGVGLIALGILAFCGRKGAQEREAEEAHQSRK